jgi:hypothetical protein
MDRERVTYIPRPDATPEGETVALATVYRFILDRYAQKQDLDRGDPFHIRKEVPDESLRR